MVSPRAGRARDKVSAAASRSSSFVTISMDGKLRGCRGSIMPHRSLIEDVADNAWKSGFGDPRFAPITEAELDRLDFHVSILSTAREFFCQTEEELLRTIRPDVDGLILREGDKQALFLPSVWEQLNDPAMFVQQLKLKAGLPAGHWSQSMECYRFITEIFGLH